MLHEILDQPLPSWMKEVGPSNHIVLSSRIRLARNVRDLVFTNRQHKESLEKVNQLLRQVLPDVSEAYGKQFSYISLEQLAPLEREILVEKHLMSAYEKAVKVDDALEGKIDYEFSERYGYLTACPTNVGTGMRASVMVHLPGLAATGKLQRIIRSILQLGYSVRGLYGEGSEGLGNIYQISNQRSMGISEEDTIKELEKVVAGVIREEEKARTAVWEQNRISLEDRVWRAYGILQYARHITGEEALALLSNVQWGIVAGILPAQDSQVFNESIVITRPNFLMKYMGNDDATPEERDVYRASVLRDLLERRFNTDKL